MARECQERRCISWRKETEVRKTEQRRPYTSQKDSDRKKMDSKGKSRKKEGFAPLPRWDVRAKTIHKLSTWVPQIHDCPSKLKPNLVIPKARRPSPGATCQTFELSFTQPRSRRSWSNFCHLQNFHLEASCGEEMVTSSGNSLTRPSGVSSINEVISCAGEWMRGCRNF